MSNFTCPHCGTDCIDSPRGYVTGCEHYPADVAKTVNVYECTTYRDEELFQRRFIICGCNSATAAMEHLPLPGKRFDGKIVADVRVERLNTEPDNWLAIVKQQPLTGLEGGGGMRLLTGKQKRWDTIAGHAEIWLPKMLAKFEFDKFYSLAAASLELSRDTTKRSGMDATMAIHRHAKEIEESYDDCKVYFASAGEFVKIGSSTNIAKRLKAIRTYCPLEISLLCVAPGGMTHERFLHKHFRDFRVRSDGEWFRLEGKLAEFVVLVSEAWKNGNQR